MAQTSRYSDRLARQRRRTRTVKIVLAVALAAVFLVGGGYVLLVSDLLRITDISVDGAQQLDAATVRSAVEEYLDESFLSIFKPRRSAAFFRTSGLSVVVVGVFPAVKSVDIERLSIHAIRLHVTERQPIGVWCFSQSCSYVDAEGTLWGQAVPSSGPLFLVVNDERAHPEVLRSADSEFFPVIRSVADELGNDNIAIRRIVIPADSFRTFTVQSPTGFDILFSLDSDIATQLDVLRIFLADKRNDPDFHPQYIDVRIDGRVYYK